MKLRLLLTAVSVTFLLGVLAVAVHAQGEPPPPYAGLKNPFSWSDTSAQESGKGIYRQSCLGCHGAKGDSLAQSDFSKADYAQSLEARPDYYYWLLSEGRLDRGMPPFKSSFSEEQRWQILTYLWSLGSAAAPAEVTLPTKPPAEEVAATLLLTAPKEVQAGRSLTLSAYLQDSQGRPIENATVRFFIGVDFFGSGLMEIGDALTDAKGVAVLEFAPRQAGDTQAVARYEDIKTAVALTVTEADGPLYEAEAGIRLPAPGDDVLIGPKSAHELGEMGRAPMSAFRLPGGILSWLLLVVVTVMLVAFTYFRVLYQVFRIPIVGEITDTDTRLVPLAGLAFVLILGIVLVLMLVTGPYSHFHLVR